MVTISINKGDFFSASNRWNLYLLNDNEDELSPIELSIYGDVMSLNLLRNLIKTERIHGSEIRKTLFKKENVYCFYDSKSHYWNKIKESKIKTIKVKIVRKEVSLSLDTLKRELSSDEYLEYIYQKEKRLKLAIDK